MARAYLSLLLILLTSFHCQLPVLSKDYDFSYMKSVYDSADLPARRRYDYIIIGGGTAGCPLAATLSQKYSVLVLERGGAPPSYPDVLTADGYVRLQMQEDNGKTPVERFTSEDGVDNLRGRILGGTSMINAAIYSRTNQEFIRELGIEWNEEVENAYEWVEETIVTKPNPGVWQTSVKGALLQAGVKPFNGYSVDHVLGTKITGSTYDNEGRRHGAVELLNNGNLDNLHIAVNASVEKIIFSNPSERPRARGVIYTDSKGKSHTTYIGRRGEIILSAGAIGSPQLLLLSGIGPKSYLSSLNISVVHSQPNVAEYMADNPRNNIVIKTPFPLEPSTAVVVGITNDNIIETASFILSLAPTPFPFAFLPREASTNESVGALCGKVPGPNSHGSLWLTSVSDVKASPAVRFNYFSDPTDLSRCVSGIRKMMDLLETEPLEKYKYKDLNGDKGFFFLEPHPANNLTSTIEDFCRSSVTSFWHYHGGCVLGKVVDAEFRVMGTRSLRVLDGSTFPRSPGTNPQATLMMLGRYVGLKMLKGRSLLLDSVEKVDKCVVPITPYIRYLGHKMLVDRELNKFETYYSQIIFL